MNVVGAALEELYRIFDILNRDKFDGQLSNPVITIQKTRGATLGHFTVDKVWQSKDEANGEDKPADNEKISFYEINIDPRWFCHRSAVDVTETLLHEMVHYYNKVSDVKDCSGNVHNKKFKAAAESVGLIVEREKSVGWGITSLSEELKVYIESTIKPDDTVFEYFRAGVVKLDTGKKRKKTMFNYECPECGKVAKAKRDTKIICGDCNCPMEMENVEDDADSESDS